MWRIESMGCWALATQLISKQFKAIEVVSRKVASATRKAGKNKIKGLSRHLWHECRESSMWTVRLSGWGRDEGSTQRGFAEHRRGFWAQPAAERHFRYDMGTCSTLIKQLHGDLSCFKWFWLRSFVVFRGRILLELTDMVNFLKHHFERDMFLKAATPASRMADMSGLRRGSQQDWKQTAFEGRLGHLWPFGSCLSSRLLWRTYSKLNPCHWWNNYGTNMWNRWNNSIFISDSKISAE